MARNYELDKQAAMDSNSGGKRIKDSGAYAGAFAAAWYEQNEKGTESVNFLFRSSSGQEAGPLTLYTHNKDGEALPAYNTLNAILTCMRQRSMQASRGHVELYDFDSKSTVRREKEVYPSLVGKDIGLLLRREEYENTRTGELKERLVIVGAYEPASFLMADEILQGISTSDRKAFDRQSDWLSKNPVKPLKGRATRPAATTAAAPDDGFDDDIPF